MTHPVKKYRAIHENEEGKKTERRRSREQNQEGARRETPFCVPNSIEASLWS